MTDTKALYSVLFPLAPTKAQRRQIEIVDSAIRCYAKYGIERTTFELIANECGISRPLVMHYFPDKEAIFDLSFRYIRAHFQALAVEAIQKATSPEQQLRAYILCTFDWVEKSANHAKVWLLIYYYCAIHEEYKKTNTELVSMGHARITALLESGKKFKLFKFKNASYTAKMVQTVITGALLTRLTEKNSIPPETFRALTLQTCFSLVGIKKSIK